MTCLSHPKVPFLCHCIKSFHPKFLLFFFLKLCMPSAWVSHVFHLWLSSSLLFPPDERLLSEKKASSAQTEGEGLWDACAVFRPKRKPQEIKILWLHSPSSGLRDATRASGKMKKKKVKGEKKEMQTLQAQWVCHWTSGGKRSEEIQRDETSLWPSVCTKVSSPSRLSSPPP